MQVLAVTGELVFHNLYFALERSDHRPTVPQGKANRHRHEDGEGSENPQHELSEFGEPGIHLLEPSVHVLPQLLELRLHVSPKLDKGCGVGVDFGFHFGQAFDDLPVGEGWGRLNRPCLYWAQQSKEHE